MTKTVETEVVWEEPALVLRASDYRGEGDPVAVRWEELRNAAVGTRWQAVAGNSRRDLIEEGAEVVYRSEDGIAVLVRTYRLSDDPDPQVEMELRLVWFAFA